MRQARRNSGCFIACVAASCVAAASGESLRQTRRMSATSTSADSHEQVQEQVDAMRKQTRRWSTSMVYNDDQHSVQMAQTSPEGEGCYVTSIHLDDFSSTTRELTGLNDCSLMTPTGVVAGRSQEDLALLPAEGGDEPLLLHSGKAESQHVAVVTDKDSDAVFVATMEADEVVNPGEYSSVRLHNAQDGTTHDYTTADGHDVHLSNMVMANGNLLMAGYTNGSGDAFGGESEAKNDYYSNAFVTKLDTEGNVLQTKRIGKKLYNNRILNMCTSEDQQDLFVVGMTDAILDPTLPRDRIDGASFAFMAKLDSDTLETTWIRQVGATVGDNYEARTVWSGPEAHGMSCAVYNDQVYMAGMLFDGAVLNLPEVYESKGGNDVFVAKFDADGNLHSAKQVGSELDDRLEDLVVDRDGNAVVLGKTEEGEDGEKTFVLKLSKNDDCWTHLTSDGVFRQNCDTEEVASV